jgi:hypothetical protein
VLSRQVFQLPRRFEPATGRGATYPPRPQARMNSPPNVRLTQKCRLRIVNQYLQDRWPLAELAADAGISFCCVYKGLALYRSDGEVRLADRRSVRRTQRRTLDTQHLQRAVELRHQRPPPPYRPALGCSFLHCGCGPEPARPWPTQES